MCAGVGSMTYALCALGATPLGFVEWDPLAQRVLRATWPGTPVAGDFFAGKWKSWPPKKPGTVRILVAGPPCIGIAGCGMRGYGQDPSTRLLQGVTDLAVAIDADFIVWENVPELYNLDYSFVAAGARGSHSLLTDLLEDAAKRGFDALTASIVSDDSLGGRTVRTRFIQVTAARKHRDNLVNFVPPALKLKPAQPISGALQPESTHLGSLRIACVYEEDHEVGRTEARIRGWASTMPVIEVGSAISTSRPPSPQDSSTSAAALAQVTWQRVEKITEQELDAHPTTRAAFKVTLADGSELKHTSIRWVKEQGQKWIPPYGMECVVHSARVQTVRWTVLTTYMNEGQCFINLRATTRAHAAVCNDIPLSQVAAWLPTKHPVYDVRAPSVTLRTFGTQPSRGSTLIFDEGVRRVSGSECWALSTLPPRVRELAVAEGATPHNLQQLAANAVTGATALNHVGALMVSIIEHIRPLPVAQQWIQWVEPFQALPPPLDRRAILLLVTTAEELPAADSLPAALVLTNATRSALPTFSMVAKGKPDTQALCLVQTMMTALGITKAITKDAPFLAASRNLCSAPEGMGELLFYVAFVQKADVPRNEAVSWTPIPELDGTTLASSVKVAEQVTNAFRGLPLDCTDAQRWISSSLAQGAQRWRDSLHDYRDGGACQTGMVPAKCLAPAFRPQGVRQEEFTRLLEKVNADLLHLKEALEQARLQVWADRIKPVLKEHLPRDMEEEIAGTVPLNARDTLVIDRCQPQATKPVPPPRPQPAPPADFKPATKWDLITKETKRRLVKYIQETMKYYAVLRKNSAKENPGKPYKRNLKPFIIGQSGFEEPARGIVWDTRKDPPVPLDFLARGKSHINYGFLLDQLKELDWPDEQVKSFWEHGTTYLADMSLQFALLPPLDSLAVGYDFITGELASLSDLGWFELLGHMPYMPFQLVPRGSTPKPGGEHRPTTDGGGHGVSRGRPLCDADGVVFKSLNETTKAGDWWPQERKPRIKDVLTWLLAMAPLVRDLGWAIHGASEDARKYFNQWDTRAEDKWKLCALYDTAENKPLFVSETVLTFGLMPCSNICQRFSVAIIAMVAAEMTRSDLRVMPRLREENPALDKWLTHREKLANKLAAVKLEFAKYEQLPKQQRGAFKDYMLEPLRELGFTPDDLRLFSLLPDIEQVDIYSCHQARLWMLPVYTDDGLMAALGTDTMVRLLGTWEEVKAKVGVLYNPSKAQIGANLTWVGAGLALPLLTAYIPAAKCLKAMSQITRALAGELSLEEYRRLLGLLQHFVDILQLDALTMNGLHRPLTGDWAPGNILEPSNFIKGKLKLWAERLTGKASSSALRVLMNNETRTRAPPLIMVSSDAAKEGCDEPGLGAFAHGWCCRYKFSAEELDCLHITLLEHAAFVMAFFMVSGLFPKYMEHPPHTLFEVDASATAYVEQSQHTTHEGMRLCVETLASSDAFKALGPTAFIKHLKGSRNGPSDCVSRANFAELARLCKILRAKVVWLPVPPQIPLLMQQLVALAKPSVNRPLSDVEQNLDAGSPSALGNSASWAPRPRPNVKERYMAPSFGEPTASEARGKASLLQLCMEKVTSHLLRRLLDGIAHHWPGDYLVQLPPDQGLEGSMVDLRRPSRQIPSGSHQPRLAGAPGEPKRLHPADERLPPEEERLRLSVLLGGWGAGNAPKNAMEGPQQIRDCMQQGQWFLDHVLGELARVGLGIATSGTQRGRRPRAPPEPSQLERDMLRAVRNSSPPCSDEEDASGEAAPLGQEDAGGALPEDNPPDDSSQTPPTPPEMPPAPPNTPSWPPRLEPVDLVRSLEALEQSREAACANTSTKASFLPSQLPPQRVVKRGGRELIRGDRRDTQRPEQRSVARRAEGHGETAPARLERPRALERVVIPARGDGGPTRAETTERVVWRGTPQHLSAAPRPEGNPNVHRHVQPPLQHVATQQRVGSATPEVRHTETRVAGRAQPQAAETAQVPKCREIRYPYRPTTSAPPKRPITLERVVGAPPAGRATERRSERATPAPDTLLYSGSAHREEIRLGTAAGRGGHDRSLGPRGDRKRHAGQMSAAVTYAAPGMERHAINATDGEGMLRGTMARITGIKQLGLNPKTAGTACAHWRLWVKICETLGTSEWRDDFAANSGQDAAGYEREKLLLEMAAVIAAQELRPKRSKQRPDVTEVQVSTLQQFIRSVRNVHKHDHYPPIEMVEVGALKSLWNGLLRRFKLKFGVSAMMPVQKNPFTKDMIEQMLRHLKQDGLKLMKGRVVTKTSRWAASARAWVATQAQTAFRKGDSLVCGTDVWTVDDLSRASITWIIDGVPTPWPTDEQLRNLKPGDYVIVRAPSSKTDPYCLVWGTRPIYGAFDPHESINMARELRDLILAHPVTKAAAASTPLFQMDDGSAMRGSFAEGMLGKLLSLQGLNQAEASKYSCHSFRIYLACALRASGASDAAIQALCRWQSLDSLRIYACLGPDTYTELITRAMQADVRAVRTHTLPVLDSVDDDGEPILERYSGWQVSARPQ